MPFMEKGSYFCISIDSMQIEESNQWLLVLENLNQENLVIHKIETYWDGGNKTLWDKREFFLTMSQERPSEDELFDSEIVKPLCLGYSIAPDPRIEKVIALKTMAAGLDGPDDLDVISTYPVAYGQSVMKPFLVLRKDELLFLGGHSKEQGEVSLIIKGWIQDANQRTETETE